MTARSLQALDAHRSTGDPPKIDLPPALSICRWPHIPLPLTRANWIWRWFAEDAADFHPELEQELPRFLSRFKEQRPDAVLDE